MKIYNVLSALTTLAMSVSSVSGAAECIDVAPATVYEAAEMSPQNMVRFSRRKLFGFAYFVCLNSTRSHSVDTLFPSRTHRISTQRTSFSLPIPVGTMMYWSITTSSVSLLLPFTRM